MAKYADQLDYSPAPTAPLFRSGGSVLTGFKPIIEQWLGGPAPAT
ncbi:hypothetical protein [Arthrobacter sp. H35-D1]|nr:hypothetical protein [Arthrobacter sp. H35-D1]MDJ0315488.1 hypothetical protein [Arthrobacter sp. H35-D1]